MYGKTSVRRAGRARGALAVVLVSLWVGGVLLAQAPAPPTVGSALRLETGQEIFEAACIGCHGPGGKGQPDTTLAFEPPATFPDFSDCNGSTRERKYDWQAIIHQGGPARGFSEIMPSFADALTREQIDKVMAYLRELCPEPAWPLGELNLPRTLMTEKAFPEDEWVITGAANTDGEGLATKLIYEKRFGARNQLEIVAPLSFVQRGAEGWEGGIGDLTFGYKRVMASNASTGSIMSLQGEVIAPTGDRTR
jgi:mono/diheme cytochrome c family protein